ncbi:hypothetical protein KAR91_73175 [Candidatus Pacearchaeota archaeon]|nr:hypothetical protein [Candidatus Pacearchaeota archaeon]
MPKKINDHAIFIGRVSPLTRGHQRPLTLMTDTYGYNNSLLVLGSSNTPISVRNLFSYSDRVKLIQHKYPDMRIIGIADQNNDKMWLESLYDILKVAFPDSTSKNYTFFTGSHDDVPWLRGYFGSTTDINVVDRDEEGAVSATKVRESLFNCQSIYDIYGVDEDLKYRELLWNIFYKQKRILFSQ